MLQKIIHVIISAYNFMIYREHKETNQLTCTVSEPVFKGNRFKGQEIEISGKKRNATGLYTILDLSFWET